MISTSKDPLLITMYRSMWILSTGQDCSCGLHASGLAMSDLRCIITEVNYLHMQHIKVAACTVLQRLSTLPNL